MADRKVEPVEHSDEKQPTSSQNHPRDESTSSVAPEGTQPPGKTSSVRNTVLDEVVANQDKQIAELERKVEKKKETIRKLSLPPPYISSPGLNVVTPHIPPSTVPQASAPVTSPAARPQLNKPSPSPAVVNTANTSQQQPHHSQPVPHNPAMAATVAAMATASTPMSTAMHPHFSFFPYPHPDNHVMTFVPTLPPHPAAQPLQPPNSATPSQPNQPSDDGASRQSRYWTPDEHQRFLAGRRTYGPRNYQQIAEVVGTRNAKQVRTHSQKYQQKLEREKARRRGDSRISGDVDCGVRAVAPKVTASSDGNATPTPNLTLHGDGHRNGSSPVSGKNSESNEAPHSSKSAEGSSNANDGSPERTAENSINAVHVNAAARAVAAEAVALSRGKLPPGAIAILEKPCAGQSQHCNPKTQSIRPKEANAVKQDSRHTKCVPAKTNATASMTVAKNGNQSSSRATSHMSKHSNNSSPCTDAPVTTSMPVSRAEKIHQATNPGHRKELTNRELAKASSRVQPNPAVNGSLTEKQQSADKRPDQNQRHAAVKIEPRVVSSMTKVGLPPRARHDTEVGTQSSHAVRTETKQIENRVTKIVKATRCERIGENVQRSVSKGKAVEEVKKEDGAEVSLVKTNSLVARPEKGVLPNGQHSGAKPSEVNSGGESSSSKKGDPPHTVKPDSSSEVQYHSGSPPSPNGSARTNNCGIALDARDIEETSDYSVAPKCLTAKKVLATTEAIQTKDGSATCLGSEKSMMMCTDQGKVNDEKNSVVCRENDEIQPPGSNQEIALRPRLSPRLNKTASNGDRKVGDFQKIENGGDGKSTKDDQVMGSEASQERGRGSDVENMIGAETKGVETKMSRYLPNGEAHKVSKKGQASSDTGDECVRKNKDGRAEQAKEKVDEGGEKGKGVQGCEQAVERNGDRQDVKRRFEDRTESAGKRQKV